MCPLSTMMQFFTILVCLLLMAQHAFAQWGIYIENSLLTMEQSHEFPYNITRPDNDDPTTALQLLISSNNEHIATPDQSEIVIRNETLNKDLKSNLTGHFFVTGNFLGYAKLTVKVVKNKPLPREVLTQTTLDIKVARKDRVIDKVFVISVATLVSIIYINFGCALNWGELRTNLKRPVGPAIAFVSQFLVMPLLSFGLGKVLFPDHPTMQLGMFFTGISPGGGASNVWVAILDGNIDLSITMTAISTLASFAMIPFWLFTLGRVIFNQANLAVPYRKISEYAIALIVPLLIGYLLQRFCKKVANFFVRILKVFSSILILFIIIFAIVTNLYLFELFSWQIVVAGMGLPWLGYMLAFLLAKIFKQSARDCLTIAVETGIQNTGIAIFLLRFALDPPEGDLTTIAPVSVAIMTPFPLMVLFAYQKLRKRCAANKEKACLLNGNTQNELDLDNNVELNKNKNTEITTIS